MRILNTQLLKEWLVINGKLSKEALAVDTGISFVKIERMLRGKRQATKPEMETLCRATKHDLDALFPLVCEARKESA